MCATAIRPRRKRAAAESGRSGVRPQRRAPLAAPSRSGAPVTAPRSHGPRSHGPPLNRLPPNGPPWIGSRRTGRRSWRRHPESNRGITDLQSVALPLGYAAVLEAAPNLAGARRAEDSRYHAPGVVAKSVDASDLKSEAPRGACGFESRLPHTSSDGTGSIGRASIGRASIGSSSTGHSSVGRSSHGTSASSTSSEATAGDAPPRCTAGSGTRPDPGPRLRPARGSA